MYHAFKYSETQAVCCCNSARLESVRKKRLKFKSASGTINHSLIELNCANQ